MKIQNQFAQMQTKDNFIKLLEIRKLNSIDEIDFSMFDNCNDNYNGLFMIEMEIVDYQHTKEELEKHKKSIQCKCNYLLVFDGYQRIKVSEFKKTVDRIKIHFSPTTEDEWCCSEDMWCIDNVGKNNIHYFLWLKDIDTDWLFDDFLKDEEYCLVLLINKEETFRVNRWLE